MVEIRPWSKSNLPLPVYETVGRVVFDPERGTMKSRVKNWVVIELDHDLTAYYRWFFRKHWYEIDPGGRRRPVYQPSWDSHLSVVRGEVSRRLHQDDQKRMWWDAHRRWHRQKVKVFYTNHIRQTGDTTGGDRPDHFWFIDAWSECVAGIRLMLDLPLGDAHTGRPYTSHITIGRTY